MTAVAACGYTALPSAGVAEPDSHTPHRNVRVDDPRWGGFADAAGVKGRSKWINEFIDMVLDDPKLWRDARAIAAARDESLVSIVNAALRRYQMRHRNELDKP